MRDLITVAEFTIKDMVKRKSFIISMIIILVLIVVGFNIPNIINIGKINNTIIPSLIFFKIDFIFQPISFYTL